MTHPAHPPRRAVPQPVRFSLMAALAKVEELEFRFLRTPSRSATRCSPGRPRRRRRPLRQHPQGLRGQATEDVAVADAPRPEDFEEPVQALREIAG